MFQSSPAFTGGRFRASGPSSCACAEGFQSSPAFTGGRFADMADGGYLQMSTFQSSPAFTGGRFRLLTGTTEALYLFQSSPAFTGGRFALTRRCPPPPRPFQSSPAFTGGRFLGLVFGVADDHRVSILARLYRRALRRVSAFPGSRRRVSILARLYRRALRCSRSTSSCSSAFQSSPAFTGGRFTRFRGPTVHPARRFNPRPPLQAGASRGRDLRRRRRRAVSILARLYRRALLFARVSTPPLGIVSILARLYRRALPRARRKSSMDSDVSILARLYRRALRRPGRAGRRPRCRFNPRPPLQAGASLRFQ